jgi:16S rRNA (guanine1207-N2)-methyltransferase
MVTNKSFPGYPNMQTLSTNPPYQDFLQVEEYFAGKYFQIITKPGSTGWKKGNQTELLVAEYCDVQPGDQTLFLGGLSGVLGVYLASRGNQDSPWFSDLDFVSLECMRRSLEINGIEHPNIVDPTELLLDQYGHFDNIVMRIPKGRKLARRWLVQALHLLKPEANLYIVGAKSEGIESITKDAAELFSSPPVVLGYKKGYRVYLLKKLPSLDLPEWSYEAGIAPDTWHTFDVILPGLNCRVFSLPGVFSYDRLDDGSAFLLDHLKVDQGEQILDIGCGYGILGLAALELSGLYGHADLVDNNLLAVASARRTFLYYSLQDKHSYSIFAGDLTEGLPRQNYSLVISNPPFHTGHKVDYTTSTALIQQASSILMPEGRLLLVANKFIRYEKIISDFFTKVELVAQNSRYHLLQAIKG